MEPWPAPNPGDRHPSFGRILVVCTANVCRSPVAERLLQRTLDDLVEPGGDVWQVSSAGVSAVRAAPDQRTWRAADAVGIDLRDHRARHVHRRLLRTDGADLVLTMERAHLRHVTTLDRSAWARAFTLKELVRRAALSTPAPDATFSSWLAQIAAGRSSTDVLSSSPMDDLADPYGRPQTAHDTMVADVDRLVAELGRLAPWCRV